MTAIYSCTNPIKLVQKIVVHCNTKPIQPITNPWFSLVQSVFMTDGYNRGKCLISGDLPPKQYLLGRAEFIAWCLRCSKVQNTNGVNYFLWWPHMSLVSLFTIKWPCVKSGQVGGWISINHIQPINEWSM